MRSSDPLQREVSGEPPLLVSQEGRVRRLVLNRPARRNALDPDLAGALAREIRAASADAAVRVLVLTGAGRAFCAGAQLDALLAASERGDVDAATSSFGVVEQVYRALLEARPPVIAMVNGPALAGGAGIVSAADFAIASEEASFGYPEIQFGLGPGMVMTLLVRLVGLRAALDLTLTGRRIGADEAARIGLVNEVVPPEGLAARVDELAGQLAALSPTAMAATKRWAWTVAEMGHLLDQGRDLSVLLALTDDARAGMRAFFDRSSRRGSGA
jgi:methylglutaconyl-CoA hydratase